MNNEPSDEECTSQAQYKLTTMLIVMLKLLTCILLLTQAFYSRLLLHFFPEPHFPEFFNAVIGSLLRCYLFQLFNNRHQVIFQYPG